MYIYNVYTDYVHICRIYIHIYIYICTHTYDTDYIYIYICIIVHVSTWSRTRAFEQALKSSSKCICE